MPGVTLTSVKSSKDYGGPKGMIIYCTGTLTNNGEVSMTCRGAYAKGENVYLYKNDDNSFEYIPAIGGKGGEKRDGISFMGASGKEYYYEGNIGTSGVNRETGGGGGGIRLVYDAASSINISAQGSGSRW